MTHVVSRTCANAPKHHAITYSDLERVGRGLYRRLTSAVRNLGSRLGELLGWQQRLDTELPPDAFPSLSWLPLGFPLGSQG
jgi:hypothetical protein